MDNAKKTFTQIHEKKYFMIDKQRTTWHNNNLCL